MVKLQLQIKNPIKQIVKLDMHLRLIPFKAKLHNTNYLLIVVECLIVECFTLQYPVQKR